MVKKFAPMSVFLLQLKNGWRKIAEILWLLLLAYQAKVKLIHIVVPT